MDKIEHLKGLLAHSHPDMTLADLMNKLCDLGLEEFDPTRKRKSAPAPARVKGSAEKPGGSKPRTPRREVWFKCGGKCSHCGSQRALQIEHIRPIAMGGSNDPNNLTLLCRPCNQRAAIEKLGLKKMDAYLNSRFI